MTNDIHSQTEKPAPPKKPRTSAFSSTSHGLANITPIDTANSRLLRTNAFPGSITKSAQTITLGSTYRGGTDPLHAQIVNYGEPSHWIRSREFEAQHYVKARGSGRAVESVEPADPDFYEKLADSPVALTSGVDIDVQKMSGKEFWKRLGKAFKENLDGEAGRNKWEFGEEARRGVGSLLWEEREREEQEREDEELGRKIQEVEEWGG